MKQRPNILFITTDQQRFDTIAYQGNAHIFTPHLDWLCKRGVFYERAYADAPVCGPSRASIMTGNSHHENHRNTGTQDWFPVGDQETLPAILTGNGYQTRAIGKMHFNPERKNYGFEHMELLGDYYREMERHPERGVPMDHGIGQNEYAPVLSTVEPSHSLSHWTVTRSVDFLETRDESRPFFLWTSFAKPHPPLDPCAAYWELYRDADVPLPISGDWSERFDQVPFAQKLTSLAMGGMERMSDAQKQQVKRAYYACISQIDYELGILFGHLRERGLLDSTWIVFTSDHGEMLGDHQLSGKSVLLEGSSHVPMVVCAPQGGSPWNPSSQDPYRELRTLRNRNLVSLRDLLPTFLEIAGLEDQCPETVQGTSLLNFNEPAPPHHLCGSYNRNHALWEEEWKYHFSEADGSQLLFHLAQDPLEQRNLADAPEQAGRMKAMHQSLEAQLGRELEAPAEFDAEKEIQRIIGTGGWPGFHPRQERSEVLH